MYSDIIRIGIIGLVLVLFFNTQLIAQQQSVSGTVIDAQTEESLPGVNVVVKGTTIGTATNAEGEYNIQVESLQDTLIFSFIGYQSQEVPINGRTSINVSLQSEAVIGEELVVVGYGTQSKHDVTGSISSVDVDEIQDQPAVSVDQLLQGKASGVNISQATGAPGGQMDIRIRGANSINAGNEPLIVIDGVPYFNNSKDPSDLPFTSGNPTNALASLNPNDIESIQILKDASATAIYGSRGSNGVIIITTKRGTSNRTNVDYNGYYGFQQVSRELDLMNGTQHARFLNDWAEATGATIPFQNPESIGEGTDWQDEVLEVAPIQSHQLSISSGEGDTRYYISGNFYNQEGIVIGSELQRYAVRANVDRKISDRVSVSQTLSYTRTINQAVPSNSTSNNVRSATQRILVTSPTMSVFDEEGNYNKRWYNADKPENPVASLKTMESEITGDNLRGNISADLEILDGLTFETMVGVDLINRNNKAYAPQKTTYIGGILNGLGVISERRITNIVNDNTLRFARTINDSHEFEVLGGFSWQTETDETSSMVVQNFPGDKLGVDAIGSASGSPNIDSFVSKWSLASFLGRINYQYNDKYLLTANFRADGSSKFGEGNKWGYFPSVSIGYRLSEEPFIEELGIFDNLKIRGSYGETGNQQIGEYQSLARFGANVQYIVANSLVTGVVQQNLGNKKLKWEKTEQLDIGIDATFLNSRVNLTFDYYQKTTEDLLFNITIPANSGFSSALFNSGSIENKGLELGFNVDVLRGGSTTWTINGNVARNENEVTDLGRSSEIRFGGFNTAFQISPLKIVTVGHSIGSFYGYTYDGVFNDQAEIDAQSVQTNVQPGDAKYKDINKDGAIDAEDRSVIGNPFPDYTFGLGNNFSFGNFTARVFLQGEIGGDILNVNRSQIYHPGNGTTNKHADLLDRWSPNNSESDIPRAGFGNARFISTYDIEDGTYLKIRNIQIGYNIPSNWLRGTMRRARIYVSGQNLVTFSDYTGYDPDIGGSSGVDEGAYPPARTLTLGVNLGF